MLCMSVISVNCHSIASDIINQLLGSITGAALAEKKHSFEQLTTKYGCH